MKTAHWVLAIDQGTTGTRAILFDKEGKPQASAYKEFSQYYPKPGWVEHDAVEIWNTTMRVIKKTIQKARVSSRVVGAIGITNQRETVVLWDQETGKPAMRAIVWQDRRTSEICARIKKRGHEHRVRQKTGLVVDPYFSGSKLTWIFEKYPRLRRKARSGKLLFGTIDTWLLWKLTGGQSHATDFTNASRTLLYNIRTKKWDSELLKIFKVPKAILPDVLPSSACFGHTVSLGSLGKGIPIHSMIGDQQAALYGQGCYKPGQIKNTYGTGCFVVMNAGKRMPRVPHGMLVTLACDERGKPVYALEGAIFIAGAAVQWLRDGLKFIKKASETEQFVKKIKDSEGVTVIPAFVGLGSPYWNPNVRGMISGLTRGTKKEHIVRATLESIAQQSSDVIEKMQSETKRSIRELRVDGGATHNPFLMQFQSDILGIPILVSDIAESTAWGAAKLAGKGSGVWTQNKVVDRNRKYRVYHPKMKQKESKMYRQNWKREVRRLLLT